MPQQTLRHFRVARSSAKLAGDRTQRTDTLHDRIFCSGYGNRQYAAVIYVVSRYSQANIGGIKSSDL
jgi:hypothetical protein